MCNVAFEHVGIPLAWDGDRAYGGYGDLVIRTDDKYMRPAEVDHLLGDPLRAQTELGWVPKYNFESLVKEMVDYDRLNKPL